MKDEKWTLSRCAVLSHSVISDSATPWTVAHQAPLSMGFPRQEYWSGLPFPTQGHLSDPGIEPGSSASRQILNHCTTWEAPNPNPEDCFVYIIISIKWAYMYSEGLKMNSPKTHNPKKGGKAGNSLWHTVNIYGKFKRTTWINWHKYLIRSCNLYSIMSLNISQNSDYF